MTSKMTMIFVNVLQDLVYASKLPLCPVRPILKDKRSSKSAYPYFQRSLCAIRHHFLMIQIATSKMVKVFVDIRQDLVYADSCPSRPVQPISRSNEPRINIPHFEDFRVL